MAESRGFISVEARPGDKAALRLFWDLMGVEVMATTKRGIDETAKLYEAAVRKNIGLTDHSLDELQALGHPYSLRKVGATKRKRSKGRLRASSITGLHGSFQVHVQRIGKKGSVIRGSGGGPETLIDALGIDFESVRAKEVGAVVGIEETRAAHVRYVVLGTRYMVARDFFAGTLIEVVNQMFDKFEAVTKFRRLRIDTSL